MKQRKSRHTGRLLFATMLILSLTTNLWPFDSINSVLVRAAVSESLTHSVRPNVDGAETISEAAKQALPALTALVKQKNSEARKQSDLAIVEIEALKLEVTKINSKLALMISDQTKEVKVDDELKLARDHCNAIKDALRKTLEATEALNSGQSLGRDILSPISNDLTQALRIAELIKQNDRLGLSSLLKRNAPTLNVTILETRTDNGVTVKFSVGSLITCLASKQGCDSKAQSVTANPNFVVPQSEPITTLESVYTKFADLMKAIEALQELKTMLGDVELRIADLMKSLEALQKKVEEEQQRIKAAQQSLQQVMENLELVADELSKLLPSVLLVEKREKYFSPSEIEIYQRESWIPSLSDRTEIIRAPKRERIR